ncbi:hypothetical protein RQM65_03290 [Pricia sp. S334]|uniref:Uncharacterized protein n=1 Tax=Pricia mediterranea TaxID=3076079 RepID=A0ABU3L1T0_9FLAO|nr:hypothetical protein [Pricia sp. S334]MDT7827689.1 hypothetical protein [Pricia sp. S334]
MDFQAERKRYGKTFLSVRSGTQTVRVLSPNGVAVCRQFPKKILLPTEPMGNAGLNACLKDMGVFSSTAKSFGFCFGRKNKAEQKDFAKFQSEGQVRSTLHCT